MSEPLGLQTGSVRVVPHDARWPALYIEEVARIEPILSSHGIALRVEHTGSTAIPGLDAKPILDILAGRRSDEERGAAIAALQAAGYQYRGEQGIPGRDFFRRGEPRQYHLHLVLIDSAFWRDHRAFRDFLRSHPDAAARYGLVKRELAARYPHDREAYIDGKTEFVTTILAEAASAASIEGSASAPTGGAVPRP